MFRIHHRIKTLITAALWEGTHVDLSDLARDIDERIKSQVSLTPAQLGVLLPRISAFTPQSGSIRTNSSIPVHLAASDPLGLRRGFQFEASIGVIKRDETASLPMTLFFSNHERGTAQLKVFCINQALLFQEASATVVVTD